MAAGPGQREPAGDHGGDQRGGPAAIASRFRVAEGRDLNKQGQDERGDAERPDVGAAHDGERGGSGLAAAQAVGQVSEPVEMKPPAEQGERGHRERRRGQRASPERMIHHEQHDRGQRAEQQPHGRRPCHRLGDRGRCQRRRRRSRVASGWRVAGRGGGRNGAAQRDHGEQGHRQPQAIPSHAGGAYRQTRQRRTISNGAETRPEHNRMAVHKRV